MDNISTTPTPVANATGTGSQNYLSRWTDNAGTLGNSTLFQNAGRIGLDTLTPGAKFHVVGTQGVIGAGTFQLDTPITFGSWSGAYPAFEIVNANLTNNNVSLFSFSDAPTGASHAGMGAVNTSHGNKWGHLFFYSKQSDGYQVRMGIYNGGYVGINTTTPTQRLAVNGNIQVLGGGNGIIFPDGSIQTKATAGTITGTGTTNQIVKFTGPNSFGNSSITELASGNVGIGTTTPAYKLDVTGSINTSSNYRMYGQTVLSSSGSLNTLVGIGAGGVNTGFYNTFVGSAAGQLNASGSENAFFGSEAGNSNKTGSYNSFFGRWAGLNNETGSENAFFGTSAGQSNTTDGNTFFGFEAGRDTTSGGSNTFLGRAAGSNNETGQSNVFVGRGAGHSNSTETGNIFIGSDAGGAPGVQYATAIGVRAQATQSNSLILGSINGVNGSNFDTNVGIGVTAPKAKLHVANGNIFIAQPNSLIITSPDGKCWFITVNNAGGLSTLSVTCP
jgi:hypothetical protein